MAFIYLPPSPRSGSRTLRDASRPACSDTSNALLPFGRFRRTYGQTRLAIRLLAPPPRSSAHPQPPTGTSGLTDTELRALHMEPGQLSDAQVMKPVGCELCRHIGYKGRMGIFEIFVIDDEVRHMINKRTSTFILRQKARALGMRTLREDGVRKVLAGLTSADEVISMTVGDVS